MSDDEYAGKVAELDRILNDCEVPLQPAMVWHLLDEIARHASLMDITPDE